MDEFVYKEWLQSLGPGNTVIVEGRGHAEVRSITYVNESKILITGGTFERHSGLEYTLSPIKRSLRFPDTELVWKIEEQNHRRQAIDIIMKASEEGFENLTISDLSNMAGIIMFRNKK